MGHTQNDDDEKSVSRAIFMNYGLFSYPLP